MALTKITKTGITDAAVERAKIGADAIDATKIADDAISEEHLDVTAITGHTELSESAAANDVLLVFDTSTSSLKKITANNVGLQAPTISSVSPTSVASGDGTGNFTFVITGTNYTSGTTASLINNSGTTVNFDTVTRNSVTQITGVIAKSSLLAGAANEPYDVKVTTANSLTATLTNQINVDQSPTFITAAGTLGTIADDNRTGVSKTVNAQDPDSAGNVTFEIQSGSLPAGLALTNSSEAGGTAIISGNATAVGSDTTSNFVLRAVDAASNTSSRAFSITIAAPTVQVFNASGTLSVPSGTTQLSEVLVVAGGGGGGEQHGGGGGAGGLVYMPNYPVTPGGTITVTVGTGGLGAPNPQNSPNCRGGTGQDSVFGAPGDPGKHPTGDVLTAKGGGGGGTYSQIPGNPGGSGGGAVGNGQPGTCTSGSTGSQPTQSGDSGAYGFGNSGGGGMAAGGGGGGAGATGGPASGGNGAYGGGGKAYNIADGTTSVYYAGGGGGGGHNGPDNGDPTPGTECGGAGGQGGGGGGGSFQGTFAAQAGTANRGGGGGGSGDGGIATGAGGKGVVIVRF